MSGEKSLKVLLASMDPVLHEGTYVFCCLPNLTGLGSVIPVATVREEEGVTVVISKEEADSLRLAYAFEACWVTLRIHSSLEAIGLTAAFATALGKASISCNVIAGYYHDHIFMGCDDAERGVQVLKNLAADSAVN